MKNASSVKDRLRNYAKKDGRTVQDIFTIYILERVLYRISVSKYADNFTLKGGILLYGLYTDKFTRATTDIDLLADHISNNDEKLKLVFQEILAIKTDDPIRFDMNSVRVENITEFKEYHGVRITADSYLDKTRIHIGIDIGFGDIVYPDRIKMSYPVLLDNGSPEIYVYSVYSLIAEKMQAIVSLGVINSRYKDFYDICTISHREDLDGNTLKMALIETFNNRNTDFEQIVAFEDDFTNDYSRQQRWRGFLKSKNVTSPLSFEDTMSDLKNFILPVINSIRQNTSFLKKWDHLSRKWESND